MNVNKIFQQIAIKKGISVTQVRQEIQAALDEGWNSSDENVKACWRKIPARNKKPTLEEVFSYIMSTYKE